MNKLSLFYYFALLCLFSLSSIAYSKHSAHFGQTEEIQYGTSIGGRKLLAYRLSEKGDVQNGKYAVMITGGVHGNEYMGLVAQFPYEFAKIRSVQNFLSLGGVVYFVPKINPDGVSQGARSNSEGLDLNRTFKSDFLSFKRESAQLSEWFDKEIQAHGLKLIMAMDYHCCNGSLIYPEISGESWLTKKDFYLRAFDKMANFMRTELDASYRSGVTKEVFGYITRGTLKDYWFQKYGTMSFTFEGSSPTLEARKIRGHIKWWDKIFTELGPLSQKNLAMISPVWTPGPTEEKVERSAHSE